MHCMLLLMTCAKSDIRFKTGFFKVRNKKKLRRIFFFCADRNDLKANLSKKTHNFRNKIITLFEL